MCTRLQLFKSWIVLSTIQISIQRIMQLVPLKAIHWIEIYPVDSTIQLLNNWGQAQFVDIFAVVARLRHETAEWSRFRLEDVDTRQRFSSSFLKL